MRENEIIYGFQIKKIKKPHKRNISGIIGFVKHSLHIYLVGVEGKDENIYKRPLCFENAYRSG